MTLRAIPAKAWFASMACLVAGAFLVLGAAGTDTELVLEPSAGLEDRPVRVARGEALLAEVLQRLADYTGTRVIVPGDEPPERTVAVSRDVPAVDLDAARRILRENGLDVRTETDPQGSVLRVERTFVVPTGRGRIIRKSDLRDAETAETEAEPSGSEARTAPIRRSGEPAARLYASEGGTSPRYMVVFETSSRKEAENALLVLRALRERALRERD